MRQTLKGMGEARHMEESAGTKLLCEKHAGVFCDGLSVPGKARRRGVGDTSSETEHRSWSFGVLEVTEGCIKMTPSGVWAQQHVCHKGM